ncbi:TonB-dependent receptor [Marinilabiliaceae bacterium ANBcel2]|nr:TonB-dependent receptor [Marinilabiliaceae bacterium ANBcel2]
MRTTIIITLIIITGITEAISAQNFHIAALITDEHNSPMPGCHVKAGEYHVVSDNNGRFIINNIPAQSIDITISFIGYHQWDTTLIVDRNHHLRVEMIPDDIELEEVSIRGHTLNSTPSLSRDMINQEQILRNLSGNLVRSLEREAGFNTMDIGAAASKPVIRGMGFNRVVVVHDGIKQEGQQWGADHGLEIDPFLTEEAEIIKGAASIEYGSEAIGGVLNLTSNRPPPLGAEGSITLTGSSVNDAIGGSLAFNKNSGSLFFKTRASAMDFADYRIPTESITYLSREIPIEKKRLKNSAGNEQNLYLQGGIIESNWRSSLTASGVWQKAGFFPGAHGVPDISRVTHDGDHRNIEKPYQNVEHLRLASNTVVQTPHSIITTDIGYQQNHRQEWAEFHTHFANQQKPEKDPDLELDFKLQTWSFNSKWNFRLTSQHSFTGGVQLQYQKNESQGYGFLLPDFSRSTQGAYLSHNFEISRKLSINSGVRYDNAKVDIEGFFDPHLYQYMINSNKESEEALFYAQRASDTNRDFGNFSYLAGLEYKPTNNLTFLINTGKSFRVPTPNELGSNGIHHGSFRHESGNKDLSAETGYYLDANAVYTNNQRHIAVSPYIYNFNNYIFLEPSGSWSHLPHSGQIYNYTEAKAVMYGVEASYTEEGIDNWRVEVKGEWLYSYQKGDESSVSWPLPFTPPANIFTEVTYLTDNLNGKRSAEVSLNFKMVADQNRVTRNEMTTKGYNIAGASIMIPLTIGENSAEIYLQGNNLLNKRFYNHISFYRRLNIPEPGRNIQLTLNYNF